MGYRAAISLEERGRGPQIDNCVAVVHRQDGEKRPIWSRDCGTWTAIVLTPPQKRRIYLLATPAAASNIDPAAFLTVGAMYLTPIIAPVAQTPMNYAKFIL